MTGSSRRFSALPIWTPRYDDNDDLEMESTGSWVPFDGWSWRSGKQYAQSGTDCQTVSAALGCGTVDLDIFGVPLFPAATGPVPQFAWLWTAAGAPQRVTNSDGSTTINVPAVVWNYGTEAAESVMVTSANLVVAKPKSTTPTTTALPIALGTFQVGAGSGSSTTLSFAGTAGVKGASATLLLKGTYVPQGASRAKAFTTQTTLKLP